MTTSTITKIKNGAVVLPKEIQKLWRGAELIIIPSQDSVYIKKITKPPSLSELRPKLLKLGKMISKKDLDNAIKWARKQK